MPTPIECHVCAKETVPTVGGKYRNHKDQSTNEPCDASGTFVPGGDLPPEVPTCRNETTSRVESSGVSSAKPSGSGQSDAPVNAPSATPGTESSPTLPDAAESASTATDPVTPAHLPGAEEYADTLGDLAQDQYDAYRAEVTTKALAAMDRQPRIVQPTPYVEETIFRQPGPAGDVVEFVQPASRRSEAPVRPMTELGKEVTARLKEMFHAYSNRQERSQQTTLGPSEIGSPCDRRLAMSLMRLPRVNPGGDGWASFVGTCMHAGLAEMFAWADAGSGRYAVETPLTFPTVYVPKGTGDLLDRTLLLFLDHKGMGRWSRNKLRTSGPSDTYRVQVHTYAYGARLRGEKVEHVAIVAWPRDEASLDDLYTWTERYDPAVAREGLARVDAIAEKVEALKSDTGLTVTQIAAGFEIRDDCRFCPFYQPGARDLSNGGCNGRT